MLQSGLSYQPERHGVMQRANVEFAVLQLKAAQTSSVRSVAKRTAGTTPAVTVKGVRAADRPVSLVDPNDTEAVEVLLSSLLGIDEKGLFGRIGKGRGLKKLVKKPAAIDPDAIDADNDGMVQEGTTAERPAPPGAVRSLLGRAATRAADALDRMSGRRQSKRKERKPGKLRGTVGEAAISLADRLDGGMPGKPDLEPGDGKKPGSQILPAAAATEDLVTGDKLPGRQFGSAFSNEKSALFEARSLSQQNPGKEFHVVKNGDGKFIVVDTERYDAQKLESVGSFSNGDPFSPQKPKQLAASLDVKPKKKKKQNVAGTQYGGAFKTQASADKAALNFSKEKNGPLHVIKGEDGKFRIVNDQRLEALGVESLSTYRGGQKVGGDPAKDLAIVLAEPTPDVPEKPELPGDGSADGPKPPDEVVASVASRLHDAWRAGRKKDDGTYEPRMKDDGKGGEVDIANTNYADLPPKWQEENKKAAESALQAILDNPDADTEELADIVHQQWLARNGEWAPAEQKLPYAELSEAEKQKDRDVVLAAMEEAKKAGLVKGDKTPDGKPGDAAPATTKKPVAKNADELMAFANSRFDAADKMWEAGDEEGAKKAAEQALADIDEAVKSGALKDKPDYAEGLSAVLDDLRWLADGKPGAEDTPEAKKPDTPTAPDAPETPKAGTPEMDPAFQAEVLKRMKETPEYAELMKAQAAIDNELALGGKRVDGSVIDLAEKEASKAFSERRKKMVKEMLDSGWDKDAPNATDKPNVSDTPDTPEAGKKVDDAKAKVAEATDLSKDGKDIPKARQLLDEAQQTVDALDDGKARDELQQMVDEARDKVEDDALDYYHLALGDVDGMIDEANAAIDKGDLEEAKRLVDKAEEVIGENEEYIQGGADGEDYVQQVESLRGKLQTTKNSFKKAKKAGKATPEAAPEATTDKTPDTPGTPQVPDNAPNVIKALHKQGKVIDTVDNGPAGMLDDSTVAKPWYNGNTEWTAVHDVNTGRTYIVDKKAYDEELYWNSYPFDGSYEMATGGGAKGPKPTKAQLLANKPYKSGTFIADGAEVDIPDGTLGDALVTRRGQLEAVFEGIVGSAGSPSMSTEDGIKLIENSAKTFQEAGMHKQAAEMRNLANDIAVLRGVGRYDLEDLSDEDKFNLLSPQSREAIFSNYSTVHGIDLKAAIKKANASAPEPAPTEGDIPEGDAPDIPSLEVDGKELLKTLQEKGKVGGSYTSAKEMRDYFPYDVPGLVLDGKRRYVLRDDSNNTFHIVDADAWDEADPDGMSNLRKYAELGPSQVPEGNESLNRLKTNVGIMRQFDSRAEFDEWRNYQDFEFDGLPYIAVSALDGDDRVYLVSPKTLHAHLTQDYTAGSIVPTEMQVVATSNSGQYDKFYQDLGFNVGGAAPPPPPQLPTPKPLSADTKADPESAADVMSVMSQLTMSELPLMVEYLDLTGSFSLARGPAKVLAEIEEYDDDLLLNNLVAAQNQLSSRLQALQAILGKQDATKLSRQDVQALFDKAGYGSSSDFMEYLLADAIRANVLHRERLARTFAAVEASEQTNRLIGESLPNLDNRLSAAKELAVQAGNDVLAALDAPFSSEAERTNAALERIHNARARFLEAAAVRDAIAKARAAAALEHKNNFAIATFGGTNPKLTGRKALGSSDDLTRAIDMAADAATALPDGTQIGVFTDDNGVHHVISGKFDGLPKPTAAFSVKDDVAEVLSPDTIVKVAANTKSAPDAPGYAPDWNPSKLGTLGPNGEAVAVSVPDGANGIDSVEKAVAHISAGKPLAEVPDVHLKEAIWSLTEGTPEFEALGGQYPARFKMFDGIKKSGFNGMYASSQKDKTWAVVDVTDGKMYVSKTADRNAQEYIQEIAGNRLMQELGMPSSGIRISSGSYSGPDKYGVTEEQKAILMEHGANLFDAKRVVHLDSLSAEDRADLYSRMTPESLARAAVYDRFANYFDRTEANFLVVEDNDGRVHFHIIDHGNAFAEFKPWKWYTEAGKKVSRGTPAVESDYGFTAVGHDGVGTWGHVKAAMDTPEKKMAFARELIASVRRAEGRDFKKAMTETADMQGITGPERERLIKHGEFLDSRKGDLDSYVDGALRSLGMTDEQIKEARGAGEKPFAGEEQFGSSPYYEGATSFTDTLTKAHALEAPGSVYTPLSVAGSVDGQMGITGHREGSLPGGVMGPITEMRVNLDDDTAADLRARVMTEDGWQLYEGFLFPQAYDDKMIVPVSPGDAGSVLRSGSEFPDSLKNAGWSISPAEVAGRKPITAMKQLPDGTVVYFYSGTNEQNFAGSNMVRVFRNGTEVAPDELNEVFNSLGLGDAKYAQVEDTAKRGLNLFVQSFAGHLKGSTTEEKLEYIKQYRGVTPGDVEVYYDSLGRLRMRLTEDAYARLRSTTGLTDSLGGMYKATDSVDGVVRAITSGGLQTGLDRHLHGANALKNSASTDMGTGGALYNFVHGFDDDGIVPSMGYLRTFHWVIDHDAALRELRFTAHYGDKYGAVNPLNHHISHEGLPDTVEAVKRGNFYDGMFPGTLTLEHVKEIRVRSSYERQEVLQKLANAGITEINGKPVEEFILLFDKVTDHRNVGIPPVGNPNHPQAGTPKPGAPLQQITG